MVPPVKPVPAPPADTVHLYLRVPRRELVFLNGLLESFDDLTVVKTLDAAAGIVVMMTTPSQETLLRRVLEAAAAETGLEIIEPDAADLARYESLIHAPA